jgi:urea transport system permease protein
MDDLTIVAPTKSASEVKPSGSRAAAVVRLFVRFPVPFFAILLLIILPAFAGTFRIGLFGKYLSFAFCAVGLVLAWG